MLKSGEITLKERKIAALDAIKNSAGTKFGLQIAKQFAQMIKSEEA